MLLLRGNDVGTTRNRRALEGHQRRMDQMAAAKKTTKKTAKTARGRKQDRARVAGGQDYEVAYEAKKSGRSASP